MNRIFLLGMVLGFLSLNGVGQSMVDSSFFHYYEGGKRYLELNTSDTVKAYLKIGNDDKVRLSDILENKEIINNFKKLSTIL